jgi:signal transduction histidine kinase
MRGISPMLISLLLPATMPAAEQSSPRAVPAAELVFREARDNGKGLSEEMINKSDSFGIRAMHERAEVFGGHIEIRGEPGNGTTVTVRVPLKADRP